MNRLFLGVALLTAGSAHAKVTPPTPLAVAAFRAQVAVVAVPIGHQLTTLRPGESASVYTGGVTTRYRVKRVIQQRAGPLLKEGEILSVPNYPSGCASIKAHFRVTRLLSEPARWEVADEQCELTGSGLSGLFSRYSSAGIGQQCARGMDEEELLDYFMWPGWRGQEVLLLLWAGGLSGSDQQWGMAGIGLASLLATPETEAIARDSTSALEAEAQKLLKELEDGQCDSFRNPVDGIPEALQQMGSKTLFRGLISFLRRYGDKSTKVAKRWERVRFHVQETRQQRLEQSGSCAWALFNKLPQKQQRAIRNLTKQQVANEKPVPRSFLRYR